MDCLFKAKDNSIIENPTIVVQRLWDLSIRLQDVRHPKVKIFNSFFHFFLFGLNIIDYEESEKHRPETLGSILRDPGPKILEKDIMFKPSSPKDVS